MPYEVEWTEFAYNDFEQIGEWLRMRWGRNSVAKFFREIDHAVSLLRKRPNLFQFSDRHPQFRKILINKHTSLFFRIDGNVVTLIAFWNHARNPSDLDEHLSRGEE